MAVILALLIQTASVLPTDASTLERSISALDKAITAREISSGNWERWLPVFAFWVAIGVAIEIGVILREYLENRAAWRRATIRLPEKPHIPKLIWELMGAILVTAGVGLEFWGGAAVAQINGDLRSMNAQLRHQSAQLVALVTQEAGDAQKSATKAAEASASAKMDAKTAHQEADELSQELKTDEAIRLELEQSLAPRLIPTWERGDGKTSFDPLKTYAGLKVSIEVLPDAEATRAASEIEGVLSRAGWKIVDKSYNQNLNMGYFDGVIVKSRNLQGRIMALPWKDVPIEENRTKAGEVLVAFLHTYNWLARSSAAVYGEPILPPNKITIMVGFKPNPFFDPEWVKKFAEAGGGERAPEPPAPLTRLL